MKSTGGGMGHAGMGWVMQRWSGGESYRGGLGHAVKQPKKC